MTLPCNTCTTIFRWTITDEAIASKASIADADIAGDYQFMRHQYGQNTKAKAFETPVNITLNADGTITGAEKGTWKRIAGTDYIHLTINDVVYRGVLVKQTIDYTNIPAIAISALSSSSGSLTMGQNNFTYQQEVWAVKADAKAAIKYTLNNLTLPFADGATLNAAPSLPTQGKMGANISWTSSDTSILTDDGKVKGKGKVTMTMTISKDEYEYVVDHARAIDMIFHKGKIAETYNIGGFNEWKNIDIIKVVIKTVDRLLGRKEGEDMDGERRRCSRCLR